MISTNRREHAAKIIVTEEDWKNGVPRKDETCAIALAARRHFKNATVCSVTPNNVHVHYNGECHHFKITPEGKKVMDNFDYDTENPPEFPAEVIVTEVFHIPEYQVVL